MKILRILLLLLLVIVAAYIIMAFIGPDNVHVERSRVINAPINTVWEETNSLQDMHDWSAWAEKDTTADYSYEGEEGTVGSVYKWDGDPEKLGSGEQEIIEINEPTMIKSELRFTSPFESTGYGTITLKDMNRDSTDVVYGFDMPVSFFNRPFMLLMDMDSELGGDFSRSLELLDSIAVIKHNMKMDNNVDIKRDEFEEKYYIGKRYDDLPFTQLQSKMGETFGAIYKLAMQDEWDLSGRPSAIYYTFNTETQTMDVVIGMPVKSIPDNIGNFKQIKLPKSEVLKVQYYGDYGESEDVYNAFDEYVKNNDVDARSIAVEEYVTDPSEEPDTSKWLTNIYYYIK